MSDNNGLPNPVRDAKGFHFRKGKPKREETFFGEDIEKDGF